MSKYPFPHNNYLNGLCPDQEIYRIFNQTHFEELWLNQRIGFVKPSLWPDSYENFLLQGTVQVGGHAVGLSNLRNSYYCQCWTIRAESASMWDRYAHDNTSVRVKTTSSKLADVLYGMAYGRGSAKYVNLNSFIGKVDYVKQAEIDAILSNKSGRLGRLTDASARGPATALMMKRDHFDDEHEVRAFYSVSSQHENVGLKPVLHGSVSEDFIEEVCFHPRYPIDGFQEQADHLVLNGVTAPIIRSTLYDPPPGI
jgi:hypothetical protein